MGDDTITNEHQMNLFLYTLFYQLQNDRDKVQCKDNVLTVRGANTVPAPQDRFRFTWLFTPTSCIMHMAEGEAVDELDRIESEVGNGDPVLGESRESS